MTRWFFMVIVFSIGGCTQTSDQIKGSWVVDHRSTIALASSRDALWLRNTLEPLTDGLFFSFDGAGGVSVRDSGRKIEGRYSVLDEDEDGLLLVIESGARTHRLAAAFQGKKMILAENNQHVVLIKQ